MKRLSDEKSIRIAAMVPPALNDRLIRQSAKETIDRKRRITPSQIVRWALEDYLDAWETAVFVPDADNEDKQ